MAWKESFDFCRAMILSRLCCSWWRPWLSWRKETPSWACTTGVRNRQGRSSCGLKPWWRRPQESKSSTISSTVNFVHVTCSLCFPHKMQFIIYVRLEILKIKWSWCIKKSTIISNSFEVHVHFIFQVRECCERTEECTESDGLLGLWEGRLPPGWPE